MAEKYIKLSDVKDVLANAGRVTEYIYDGYESISGYVIDDVDDGLTEIPIADVAPVVHAHWIKYDVDIAEHPLHCSVCGWSNHHISNREIENFGFCPNPKCGAKMDEEI